LKAFENIAKAGKGFLIELEIKIKEGEHDGFVEIFLGKKNKSGCPFVGLVILWTVRQIETRLRKGYHLLECPHRLKFDHLIQVLHRS